MPPENDPLFDDEPETFDETENEFEDDGLEEGLDGAEGEDDAEGLGSPENDAQGQRAEAERQNERPVSRAQRRVEAALREAREAKEEAARLRAQVETVSQQRANRESEAERQARLDNMDPFERQEFLSREREQRLEQRVAQAEFRADDRADRAAFERLCDRSPNVAKLATQVEDYLAQMRRGGANAPRETVVKYLLGERALAGAGKQNARNQRTAEGNRQRQTVTPRTTGGRSDTAGERRGSKSEQQARYDRIKDLKL